MLNGTITAGSQEHPSVGMNADGNFVIAWESNDGNNDGVYAQRYEAPPPAPEIMVNGNGQEIIDGDATPSDSDHTDFGNAIANSGTVTRTFIIANIGTADLTVGPVVINGSHSSDFSVTQQPSSPIPANDSVTFQITFSPSTTGTRTAQASLSNNDDDEHPYTFAIQGHGVTTPAPEQAVYLPLIIK